MYPKAYLEYLIYFHTSRDFFECHEVLEEYWKEEEPNKRNTIWVGLIQLAVSLYHFRRGNYTGAKKLIQKTQKILSNEPIENIGIDKEMLLMQLKKLEIAIKNKDDYDDINLPINDIDLIRQCEAICKENALDWGAPSNFSDEFIINKHSLRDRTEVIEERNKQKQIRKKS